LNRSGCDEDADSDILAIILMVAIVLILAALLLAHYCYLPAWPDEQVPAIYQILSIRDTDENGFLNFDSYVVLKNTGSVARKNKELFVKTYVNGIETHCNIPTLNAEEFIDGSVHTDVATIGGYGARGSPDSSLSRWYEGQLIAIDYQNGIYHPGDTMTIDIYDKNTGKIVSRDLWPRPDPRSTVGWWMSVFTHRQAAGTHLFSL
jgi:hypothetical protein